MPGAAYSAARARPIPSLAPMICQVGTSASSAKETTYLGTYHNGGRFARASGQSKERQRGILRDNRQRQRNPDCDVDDLGQQTDVSTIVRTINRISFRYSPAVPRTRTKF
jgi:hypothetical protein